MNDDLDLLQAVRLKGRATEAVLADTTGRSGADVAARIAELAARDLVISGKLVRLGPAGRDTLARWLADERAAADPAETSSAYADFRVLNAEFKALVTDWQLRDGQPNAHDDSAYDQAVIGRLCDVHTRVLPTIDRVSTAIPRLARYREKLEFALTKIRAGETAWFTRPVMDSYHTVWFELHEEFIGACGLTRAAEAGAGHAD
ncbi:hypothetical protein [Nocardia harenae]|uniref:hypothetical protein n=1 Tax=Nocardia harenae TaxID=358707 RepID=UPI0008367255|nr:hypothetical protein [Nocardia harenae]